MDSFYSVCNNTHRKIKIIFLQDSYRMVIRVKKCFIGYIVDWELMCQVVLQEELKREKGDNKNEPSV